VGRQRITGNGSRNVDYCQGTVLQFYHSNVRRGSGTDGRSWREFGSLVRRITSGLSIDLSPLGLMNPDTILLEAVGIAGGIVLERRVYLNLGMT
jgi:hypothetical protein